MSDMSLPHDPLSPDMPPTSPITLVHSRRLLAGIAAFQAFLVMAVSSLSWHLAGPSAALRVAAVTTLVFAVSILPHARIRLRYGPGLPIEYRPSLGRSRVIPLDSILAWKPIAGPLSARGMVRMAVRLAPDAPTRTVLVDVPGRLEDLGRFLDFLSAILPPSAP